MKDIYKTIGFATAYTSTSTVVTKVISILNIFIILRTYSVYEYGLFELAVSVLAIFNLFVLPGLNAVIVSDVAREQGEGRLSRAKEILLSYGQFMMLTGICGFLVMFFAASYIGEWYEGHIGDLLRILSFAILISPLRILTQIVFSTQYRFGLIAMYTTLEELAKLSFLLFMPINWDIRGLAVVFVLSQVVPLIVFSPNAVSIFRNIFNVAAEKNDKIWSSLLSHGKWGVFSSYTNGLGPSIRNFLIKAFLGTESVGIFSVALGLINHTVSLFPLGNIVGPVLSRNFVDKDKFSLLARKTIKYQMLVNIVLVGVGIVIFAPIVSLIFPNYIESVRVYMMMLVVLLPLSFSVVYTQVVNVVRLQKKLFSAIILKTFFIFLLGLVVGSLFGIIGFVVEYIVTTILFTIHRYFIVKKKVPDVVIDIKDIFSYDAADKKLVEAMKKYFKSKIGFLKRN